MAGNNNCNYGPLLGVRCRDKSINGTNSKFCECVRWNEECLAF